MHFARNSCGIIYFVVDMNRAMRNEVSGPQNCFYEVWVAYGRGNRRGSFQEMGRASEESNKWRETSCRLPTNLDTFYDFKGKFNLFF